MVSETGLEPVDVGKFGPPGETRTPIGPITRLPLRRRL